MVAFDASKPKVKEAQYIEFTVDNDTFYAFPNVGAALIEDMLDLTDFEGLVDLKPEEATQQDLLRLMKANHTYNVRLMNFLDQVLTPESAQLFASRLRMAGDQAIDKQQSQAVVRGLIEVYSKPHPTEPPLSSTNGQGGTTPNLTAIAQAKA